MNRRPAIVLSASLALSFTAAAALAAAGGQSVHRADAKVVASASTPSSSAHARHVVRVSSLPPSTGATTASDVGSDPGASTEPPPATTPGVPHSSTTSEMTGTTEPGEGHGSTTTAVMTTTTEPNEGHGTTTTEPDDDHGPTTTEPGEGNDG